jgi:hypothetical protein
MNWRLVSAALLLCAPAARAQEQYQVVPHQEGGRWNVWASEGPINVLSNNQSYWGNRFRLGGEVHLGDDHRWILGLTLLDFMSSGEATPDVGGISRAGIDFSAGVFLVPDKLWLMYSFQLQDLRGSRISGGVAAYGNEIALGYRFFESGQFNISADLGYLYVGSESVNVIDLTTGLPATATYPSCDIISLGIRFGVDFK